MHRTAFRLSILALVVLALSATGFAATQWTPINFLLSKVVKVTNSLTVNGTTTLVGTTTAGALNAGATTATTFTPTGRITAPASAAVAGSGLRVSPGIAPTTPANGDVWTTAAGIFARVGGNTLDLVAAVPWAAPTAAIGSTTPVAGNFTTLGATAQITSTLANGTPPLVVASSTNIPNLNASSLGGATFAAPGAIGGGTPNTATFTRLTTSAIGQFADADATPAVGTANVWRCYGRAGLTITDFDDPVGVQEITVLGAFLNEIQTLTVTDGAAADAFTVTYAGQTTASLAWDVSAANMQAALEALSNIDPGDVAVTEVGGVYTVIFQGTLAETNVDEMTATPTDCTVTPATTQVGAAANNSTVDDGANIQLANAWVATGGNTLRLVYDTKKAVWRELARVAS